MKILSKNNKEKKTTFPFKSTCNCCNCEVEIESEDDYVVGTYGGWYYICPQCNEEVLIDNNGTKLTVNNLEFPKHFHKVSENAKQISSIDVVKYIKSIIDDLEHKSEDERIHYVSCGDLFLFVHELRGDGEYYVVVANSDGWYDTYIPMN